MIGRLNHVAIAVPDLAAAAANYRDVLGAKVSSPQDLPDHGVTVIFVELPNTKIELLHPLGANSPIAKFLENNPGGGIHHLSYEVQDIYKARDQLKALKNQVAKSADLESQLNAILADADKFAALSQEMGANSKGDESE